MISDTNAECDLCETEQACTSTDDLTICSDRPACEARCDAALDGYVRVTGECFEETGAPDQDELREWAKADTAPDDELRAAFVCAACRTSEYEPDRHLPNFCIECVKAWQKGCYQNRLDPRYLQADITERLYAVPPPATPAQPATDQGGEWVAGECWEEAGAPTQEELRLEAIAKEAPEGCTACNDAGCPCCDTELASETPPPHTWITHTGRTRTERYPAESAVMVEPEPPVDNWGGFRSDIPIEPPPPTLPKAIALALAGTANPVCKQCGDPAFVSSNGHLYCKSLWQLGTCDGPGGWQGYIEPLMDDEPTAEFYAQAQPACPCGSTSCPCCDPSHPEAPERGWEHEKAGRACPNCGSTNIAWNERPPRCRSCDPDPISHGDLKKQVDRFFAQPAPTCGACGGPHHIQRCPEIRTLLMPGPLPAPHKCPSCGDARARPGLCAACREAGEAIEMERRFEFSALPAEWSF